ncbi:MAG: 4Fe-4S dicluster domain-containing protein [Calditrichaeota bacterium]|nr:4Fe-4S dicluster domain-containing protein [Calditrichota bacterium]HQU70843.1 4Fe-4S dicluster domain-containing protein [Calditrichia bacterium]
MKRRDFLKFVGMASSATVLASCGVEKSTEKILPFVVPPQDPDYIPGDSMWRNTTCTECGVGCGTSVRTVDFNAVKMEGLKGHPINDGALCLRGQVSLTRLYHPNRVKNPRTLRRGGLALGGKYEEITWEAAYQLILDKMAEAKSKGLENVYLAGNTTGSLSAALNEFCAATGVERLPHYEALPYATLREGYRILFGQNTMPEYKTGEADFLLSIGADVVETFNMPVAQASGIQEAREKHHLKWVHLEPHASMTGFKADKQHKIRPGGEAHFLTYLLNYIMESKLNEGNLPSGIPSISKAQAAANTGLSESDLEHLCEMLAKAKNPLLIVGGVSTAHKGGLNVAVLAGLVQWAAGMIENTVSFSTGRSLQGVGNMNDMTALGRRLQTSKIGVLFTSRVNPVATAPAATGFGENYTKAHFTVAFAEFFDETADMADLVLPLSDDLESWGDVEARRGLLGVVRPVIKETIYNTRTEGDLLLTLGKLAQGMEATETYEAYVKARWAGRLGGAEGIDAAVAKGFVDEKPGRLNISLQNGAVAGFLGQMKMGAAIDGPVLYCVPSVRTGDGRSKVLPLTSEIPDPLTTVAYGGWVSVSKASAEKLGLQNEHLVIKERPVVKVEANSVSLELPHVVQPGLPEDVYVVQRDHMSTVMMEIDPQTGEPLGLLSGVSVSDAGRNEKLAIIAGAIEQGHRNITREEHTHHHDHFHGDETLYPDPYDRYPDYRWGISVDMETCVACNACVAACYIENNIPVVGEAEVLKGREMAWLRVQPYYFTEESGEVTLDNLVMMCQQCDFAPCENVCPVYATNHDHEGLNVMTYNRCVGTRYCHNNCPYKVRRFNWFDWTNEGYWNGPMARMANPDVYVRPKGVMEKCTFCYGRIRVAKDKAKDEGRLVREGDITPACAQTCPTHSITFGNLKDQESQVYKQSQRDGSFRALESLGTSPGVHYVRKPSQRKEEHA